jgi:hypothetical protein
MVLVEQPVRRAQRIQAAQSVDQAAQKIRAALRRRRIRLTQKMTGAAHPRLTRPWAADAWATRARQPARWLGTHHAASAERPTQALARGQDPAPDPKQMPAQEGQ